MIQIPSVASAVRGKYHDHVIDLLRGIAALTVFVSHSDQGGLMKFQFVTEHKTFMGRYGVFLFFILSGYLIWSSAQRMVAKTNGYRVYAVHRITRIVPLYVVNIAFVVFLLDQLGSAFHPIVTTDSVLRHLTFSQSLVPSVSRDLNPVLWTLTHEAIYYAMVPLLLLTRAPVWGLTGLAAACLLADKFGFRSTFTPFLTLLYLFAIGILVAEKRLLVALVGTVLLLAVLGFSAPVDTVDFYPSVWAAATFVLVWPAFGIGMRLPGLLPLTRPLCWAGVVSYSLYIWHYLIVNIVGTEPHFRAMYSVFGSFWVNDYSRALIFTALVLGLSTASYLIIEVPSMTSLRRSLVRLVLRSDKAAEST